MDKTYFIELTNKLYRITLFFPEKEPLREKVRKIADEVLSDLTVILEGVRHEKREAAFRVERNLQIMEVLLELSKRQLWIEKEEIERVQENYDAIKREIEEFNDMSRRQMLKRGIGREMAALVEGDLSKEGETPFKKEEQEEREEQEGNTKEERTEERGAQEEAGFAKKEVQPSSTSSSTPKEPAKKEREFAKLNKRQQKILGILKNEGKKMQVRDFQRALPDTTKRTLRRDLSAMVEKGFAKRTGKGNTTYYIKA